MVSRFLESCANLITVADTFMLLAETPLFDLGATVPKHYSSSYLLLWKFVICRGGARGTSSCGEDMDILLPLYYRENVTPLPKISKFYGRPVVTSEFYSVVRHTAILQS